jgi:hypothetical protein
MIFVRSFVVVILFVIHLLLIFLHNQPIHKADVPGPCPGNFLPLFVEMMILIPAKGVIIITQGLELPPVCSTEQPAASFINALLIMASRLKLMVSGNNAANDCPQKILSWDNAQGLAIILSDLKRKHYGLTRRISDIVTITTAPSTLACALNHAPDRS